MDERSIAQAKKLICEANRILITSHIRPDGDAIGSVLGFGLGLIAAGKDVQMVLADGVPATFQHLVGSTLITKRAVNEFDISIVLDCSDLIRIGKIFDPDYSPTINIDHHVTNQNFAQINLVYPEIPATAEILTELMPKFGIPIGKDTAEAFLTGIITDTLGFRTTNLQPTTLRVAADLMELDCDLPFLYNKALHLRSFESVQYWGTGLSTMEKDDCLLWTCLTQEDRKAIGYPGRDDADLINLLSSIEGIDIAIIFVEQPKDSIKVSWRARKGYDVSQIARSFGGGGHKPAAGADIQGDLESVKREVLGATRSYLNLLKSQGKDFQSTPIKNIRIKG